MEKKTKKIKNIKIFLSLFVGVLLLYRCGYQPVCIHEQKSDWECLKEVDYMCPEAV